MAAAVLDVTIPFRFLTAAERAALAADVTEHVFEAGQVILRQGDAGDDRVCLLEEGAVQVLDASTIPPVVASTIGAGHYFGERSALFGEPRRLEVRALTRARVSTLPGGRFLRLVAESRSFAQALGDILRDKQGIFDGFDQFLAELGVGVAHEEIEFRKLLPRYRALEPALHPLAEDPTRIDFAALAYAVRRLPDNVTRTFAYFLTDNLPELYGRPDETFTAIPTGARPRSVYEILPGKSMMLIRDGLSDLIDFVTCLCLYSIEARKLRKRLGSSPEALLEVAARVRADTGDDRAFLERVFSKEEVDRIVDLWPARTVARLHEIALHHEDFTLHIRKQRHNYNSRHSELWSSQIARATRELVGHDPSSLPPEMAVHVISSNTHSVANCLSAALTARAGEVLAWAERTGHPHAAAPWPDRMDQVYALARDFFAAHPDAAAERRRADAEAGILRLSETAFTGIQVELIDTARLARAGAVDPGVAQPHPGERALIVNIDFAFGQQAEEIAGNLIALFGKNLASVNVLGKAGALTGRRGDILVPTLFVEQTTEALHPLAPPPEAEIARLRRRAGEIGVHVGPMLTVAGTLLQNGMMLHFYRHLWRCVGLEMEGAYYHRKVFESVELGVVRRDVALRYLYYVSDLPLDHGSNLSGRMSAREGIPPLYAITREILTGIFESAAR